MMKAERPSDLDEGSLIRLYVDLTGCGEGTGRATFMYLCCREDEFVARRDEVSKSGDDQEWRHGGRI